MKKIALILAALVGMAKADGTFRPSSNGLVNNVGSQGSTTGYFTMADGTSGCGIFYIDLSSAAGRAMYTTVLQVYTSGIQINRIDYTGSGTCVAGLVEVGPVGPGNGGL